MSPTSSATLRAAPVIPNPLYDDFFDQPELNGSLPWWSCIASAFARSSGAGGKRAHVALPISPVRQGSSGRDRHHRAHGKVARHHEERAVSPPRRRDEDDYTPSEDVDESTSQESESERLNSVLSSACFVWLFLVACCAMGPGPLGPGPGAAGRFPFRGPGFNIRFVPVLTGLDATTSDHRAFDGRPAHSCANSGVYCVKSTSRRRLRRLTLRRTSTNVPVGSQPLQLL
jgi:hypothetical protein